MVKVWHLRFKIFVLGLGLRLRLSSRLGFFICFRHLGLGFNIWGLISTVYYLILGFGILVLGFTVYGRIRVRNRVRDMV